MSTEGTALAGCVGLALVIAANVLFWAAVIWAVATFVLPHLSFWH